MLTIWNIIEYRIHCGFHVATFYQNTNLKEKIKRLDIYLLQFAFWNEFPTAMHSSCLQCTSALLFVINKNAM